MCILTVLWSFTPGMLFAPFVWPAYSHPLCLSSQLSATEQSCLAHHLRQTTSDCQLPAAHHCLGFLHDIHSVLPASICVFAGSPSRVSSQRERPCCSSYRWHSAQCLTHGSVHIKRDQPDEEKQRLLTQHLLKQRAGPSPVFCQSQADEWGSSLWKKEEASGVP